MEEAIKCPKCQSGQLATAAKGFSLMTGLIGSAKMRITCLKCGTTFKPGEDYDAIQKIKEQRQRGYGV